MKVAHACIRFDAPGGAEDHVRAVATGLASRGHEVTVHASDLRSEVPWTRLEDPPARVAGVDVVRHRAHRDLLPLLRYPVMPTMLQALAGGEADVLHGHSHRYFQLRAAALAHEATGTPLVITPHFHPAEGSLPWWKRALSRVADLRSRRTVYRHAARVLCVTEREARTMRRFVDASRLEVVPNGIHAAEWTPPPEPADEPWEDPVWGFAGRLASNKGLRTLLHAFASWRRKREAGSLVLVGEDWGMGPEVDRLARELQVADHVHRLGFVSREAYRRTLARFDVLCLPSEWEAFGIVLLEAWCAGTPVVATRVGGVPDVVEHGRDGLLVPHGDAAALKGAVTELLADPARRRAFAERGRARTLERFTWERVVDEVERVYEEVTP